MMENDSLDPEKLLGVLRPELVILGGRYRLERRLERVGGSSEWLAVEVGSEARRTLRFLPPALLSKDSAYREFSQRARSNWGLSHPSINRDVDCLREGGLVALLSEYRDGSTLGAIRAARPSGVMEAADLGVWARTICSALDHAQQRGGIAHGDLKPSSLLETEEKELLILGWGVSVAASQLGGATAAARAGLAGTLAYSSPQRLDGKSARISDDIYALGAVFYELLTGRPPFHSGNLALQIRHQAPPSLRERRRELGIEGAAVPEAWEVAIAACLEKEPSDRPPSGEALLDLLNGNALPSLAKPVSTAPTSRVAPAPRPKNPFAPVRPIVPLPGREGALLDDPTQPPTARRTSRKIVGREEPGARRVADDPNPSTADSAEAAPPAFAAAVPAVDTENTSTAAVSSSAGSESKKGSAGEKSVEAPERESSSNGAIWFAFVVLVLGFGAAFYYLSWLPEQEKRQQLLGETETEPASRPVTEVPETSPVLEEAELASPVQDFPSQPDASAIAQREAERAEAERVEAEALAAEQRERERLEAEQEEAARLEAERQQAELDELERQRLANARGGLVVRTDPAGADVVIDGEEPQVSPAVFRELRPGDLSIAIQMEGYRTVTVQGQVQADQIKEMDTVALEPLAGSVRLSLELGDEARGEDVTLMLTSLQLVAQGSAAIELQGRGGLQAEDLPVGLYRATARKEGWDPQTIEFAIEADRTTNHRFAFTEGAAFVQSVPSGAEIWQGDKLIGRTPHLVRSLRPGSVEFLLKRRYYEDTRLTANVQAGESVDLTATMSALPGPPAGVWEREVTGVGIESVWIQPGSFEMGSLPTDAGRNDDEMRRTVTLENGFWMGKYEVTQDEWTVVMGGNPSLFKAGGGRLPVDTVSWSEAQEFCRRVNEQERRAGRLVDDYEYRLPTEAEWEYAARAGTEGGSTGDELNAVAWHAENSGHKSHPVGSLEPNDWGLYDMQGNVSEWCHDWYGAYSAESTTDPTGPRNGTERVYRGGNWGNGETFCRPAKRGSFGPEQKFHFLGLRLVLGPKL